MANNTTDQGKHYFRKIDKKKPQGFSFPNALLSSSVGMYMIIPIFLGLTLGLVLDNLVGVRPVFTLVFLFFGTIGSFYNIVRTIKENGGTNSSHKHQS